MLAPAQAMACGLLLAAGIGIAQPGVDEIAGLATGNSIRDITIGRRGLFAAVCTHEIVVLEVEPLRVRRRYQDLDMNIANATFDSAGDHLYVASYVVGAFRETNRVKWLHLESGKYVKEIAVVGRVLDIHPSGKAVLADTDESNRAVGKEITIVDVANGKILATVQCEAEERIRKAQLSFDAKHLVLLFGTGDVRLIDCGSKKQSRVSVHERTDDFFISPQGDRLVTRWSGSAEIWRIPSAEKLTINGNMVPMLKALLANGRVGLRWPREAWT